MTIPFQPRDLSISLSAVSKPQHVLNGGPKGATFPGWFLTVLHNEGYDIVAGPVQLTPDEVTTIANTIDVVLAAGHANRTNTSTVANAVGRCERAMRDDLQRQLDAARSSAARIPDLERRLGIEHVCYDDCPEDCQR